MPTKGNTHEVAQSVMPDARVAYVERLPRRGGAAGSGELQPGQGERGKASVRPA
ncbi:MAG: SAM-dependent methyltransferase [Trebonia sp.]